MKRVPAALLVGLALYVLHDAGMLIQSASLHWKLAAGALDLVSWALIAIGLGELAHRTKLRALRVASVLFAIVALWTWARPIVEVISGKTRWDWSWFRYTHVFVGVTLTGSILALVSAADGLRRAPLAAVLPLVAMVTQGWIPGTDHVLLHYLQQHEAIANLYWLVNGLMLCGGILVLAKHVAVEPETDVKAGVIGLRIVERALVFGAVFGLAMVGVRLAGWKTSRVVEIGAPLLALASIAVASLGCLWLARANFERQRCMQVVIGAALVLWWCGLSLIRSVYVVGHYAPPSLVIDTWSIVGPLVVIAGFMIVAMAVLVGLPALREALAARVVTFLMMSTFAVLLHSGGIGSVESIGFMVVIVGLNAGAWLAYASFVGRAAEEVAKLGVPEARVVSTSPL